MTEELKWAWLAGLLEGEGCFSLKQDPRSVGSRARAVVAVKMTDKDVIQRAAMLMGGNAKFRADNRENKSDCYECSVSGAKAVAVMRGILPHMGARRSEKIQAILDTPNMSHTPR